MSRFGDERLPAKFWQRVRPSGDCWLWIGYVTPGGYGTYPVGKTPRYAHRVSYAKLVGAIEDGHTIDHVCSVRNCVNPSHLRSCTQRENVLAPHSKSRTKINAQKTHCVRGHEFSPQNTLPRGDRGQWRTCRLCQQQKKRRYRTRHSAPADQGE